MLTDTDATDSAQRPAVQRAIVPPTRRGKSRTAHRSVRRWWVCQEPEPGRRLSRNEPRAERSRRPKPLMLTQTHAHTRIGRSFNSIYFQVDIL